MKRKVAKMTPDEILEELMNKLSECNSLVSVLGKKVPELEVRKLRNDLMFARSKVRNLAKTVEEMKRPVNSFKLNSD